MNPRIEIRRMRDKIDEIEKRLIQVEETAEDARNTATARGVTSIPEPDSHADEWRTRVDALEQSLKDLAARANDHIAGKGVAMDTAIVPDLVATEPEPDEEPEEEEPEPITGPVPEPVPKVEGPSDVYTHVMDDGRTYFLFKGSAPWPYFTRDMGAAIAKGSVKIAEIPEGCEVIINERFNAPQLRKKKQ